MPPEPDEITGALDQIRRGSAEAKNWLGGLLEERFRRRASWLLRHEPPGITLATTDLMHEAWVAVLKYDELTKAENRNELFRAFARAMRQALLDHADRRRAKKRGGDRRRAGPVVLVLVEDIRADPIDMLAVDEAFDALAKEDARAAEVMGLRVFGGYEVAEITAALGVGSSTVERDSRFGRRFLRHFPSGGGRS